jgi:hypothetical protein
MGYRSYASELQSIGFQMDETERNIESVKFCFDAYLHFTRDGGEPTRNADGSVCMDAAGATRQLEESIGRLLGYVKEG